MATKCRKAVDRAARDCGKAYDALVAMRHAMPQEHRQSTDRLDHWIRELGEYSTYLSQITWPDQVR
jgi:hypothetical protein